MNEKFSVVEKREKKNFFLINFWEKKKVLAVLVRPDSWLPIIPDSYVNNNSAESLEDKTFSFEIKIGRFANFDFCSALLSSLRR